MAFICILCGGLQVLLLLVLTGILVSLAALSRLMELTFTIVQPTVLFMLRQSVRLIVFWIVLSLQRMSIVLGNICSRQPSDSGSPIDFPFPDTAINIGTTPIRVPYSPHPYEAEQVADIEKKTSLPAARELESPEENFEDAVSRGSAILAIGTPTNLDLASKTSAIPFPKSSQSSRNSGDHGGKASGTNISEEVPNSTS